MTQSWTPQSLADLLPKAMAEDSLTATLAENAVVLSFPDAGDMSVIITVEGDQMLAATLLWKCTEQGNRNDFEREMLRTHKMMPLSTFGITEVGGEEWYELFGALSATSSLENVVLELRFLVQNALEVAEARLETAA